MEWFTREFAISQNSGDDFNGRAHFVWSRHGIGPYQRRCFHAKLTGRALFNDNLHYKSAQPSGYQSCLSAFRFWSDKKSTKNRRIEFSTIEDNIKSTLYIHLNPTQYDRPIHGYINIRYLDNFKVLFQLIKYLILTHNVCVCVCATLTLW